MVSLHDADGFNNIVVEGGAGNDFLSGGDITHTDYVDDILFQPNAVFVLPEGNVGEGYTLIGGQDNDVLLGGTRKDTIEGGDNDDVIQGRGGDDRLFGGEGKDFVAGSVGDDILTCDDDYTLYIGVLAKRLINKQQCHFISPK